MIRSFIAGVITGGLVVWVWKDDIQALLEEQARAVRQSAADRVHAAEETAEDVFDRAAAPLRRAEELLDQGRAHVADGLKAAERKIRP
jgi:hypothetical protein